LLRSLIKDAGIDIEDFLSYLMIFESRLGQYTLVFCKILA